MYTDILLATDGSDSARRATAHAIDLAARFDATLHAVAVVDTRVRYVAYQAYLQDVCERAVADVIREGAAAGIPVVTTVRTGLPHEELVEYADDYDVDLLVVGSTGRSGLDKLALGSITERVLRTTTRPVLVVPPARSSVDE
ncbi:universal stress protein [Haloferacaceae archaeon DSL9]